MGSEQKLVDLHFRRDARSLFHPIVSIGLFRFPLYVFAPIDTERVDNKVKLAVLHHELRGHVGLTYRHPTGLTWYMLTWLCNLLMRTGFASTEAQEECQLLAMEIQRKLDILLKHSVLVQEGVHFLLMNDPGEVSAFASTSRDMQRVFPTKASNEELVEFLQFFHENMVMPRISEGSSVHAESYELFSEVSKKLSNRPIVDLLGEAYFMDFSKFSFMDISCDDLESEIDSNPLYLSPNCRLKNLSAGKPIPPGMSMKPFLTTGEIVLHPKFPQQTRDQITQMVKKSGSDVDRYFKSPFNPLDKIGLGIVRTPYGSFSLMVPYLETKPPLQLAKALVLEDYAREMLSIKYGLIEGLSEEDRLFLSAMKWVIDADLIEVK